MQLVANPLSNNQVITVDEFEKYLYLDEGWSGLEANGVWTEGDKSSITLKHQPSNDAIGFHFNGHYFNGDEKTTVIINGVEVGHFILKDKTVALPEGMNESEILTIELQHGSVVSPHSLDPSSLDKRRIKYKLQEIGLIATR